MQWDQLRMDDPGDSKMLVEILTSFVCLLVLCQA